MALWIVFATMTALAALMVLLPIIRARGRVEPNSLNEINVYVDQLSELDRDVDRGLIASTEAEAARTEISRRILQADRRASTPVSASSGRSRMIAGAIVLIAIPGICFGIYSRLGDPSLPDQPLLDRKANAINTKSPEELVAMLDARLAANPNDVKGWDLAGPIYLRMGRFEDAVTAFQNAIRLNGETVERLIGKGEGLTAAAQGVVTADARAAFETAAKLAPDFHLPKMYLALALSQDGKFAESATAWKQVIASAKGEQPWLVPARKELAAVEAQLARINGTPVPAGPRVSATAPTPPEAGPAAGMIEAMVGRLSERLTAQGGTAEEWARLVKSYGVLGRKDAAKAALDKARTALANDKAGLETVDAVAREIGLTM